MIILEKVSKENAKDIYTFEIENRHFFESSLPSRGDDYYKIDNFNQIISEICEEQELKSLYMNIIRNDLGEMVGRINLFPIKKDHFNTAFELGYRIAEKHQGKGYASEAVKQLLQLAFNDYDVDYIEALTSPKNVASQIILLKNGFSFVKRIQNDVSVNGVFEDSVVFERTKE